MSRRNSKISIQEVKLMKVLVVDDEKLARERLNRMVMTLGDYEVVGSVECGEKAVSQAITQEPDIVLLDIRMPGMDGIETGNRLSSLSVPPAVIYCTAFGEHAIEAFGVNASGYLMKPIRREDLISALGNASRMNKPQLASIMDSNESPVAMKRTHISARTRRGIELIPLKQVKFFQADHKYVTVRHEGGEVLIDDTLRDLEVEFSDRLVRIHRNALVAVQHLEGLERDSNGCYKVRMRGVDERLGVSRRHVSGLRKLVQNL